MGVNLVVLHSLPRSLRLLVVRHVLLNLLGVWEVLLGLRVVRDFLRGLLGIREVLLGLLVVRDVDQLLLIGT